MGMYYYGHDEDNEGVYNAYISDKDKRENEERFYKEIEQYEKKEKLEKCKLRKNIDWDSLRCWLMEIMGKIWGVDKENYIICDNTIHFHLMTKWINEDDELMEGLYNCLGLAMHYMYNKSTKKYQVIEIVRVTDDVLAKVFKNRRDKIKCRLFVKDYYNPLKTEYYTVFDSQVNDELIDEYTRG